MFERQYKFESCKDCRPLPFDFAINLDEVKLIEYQGEQHYKQTSNWDLKTIKKHEKENWCIENQVPLLRIPFWEFSNINEIITSFLSLN